MAGNRQVYAAIFVDTRRRRVQPMSCKGNCYDNAVMENFFGHLKEELFHRFGS